MTSNQIAFINAMENRRTNMANEALKDRANQITEAHNRADESIRAASNDIAAYQADITNGHYQRMDNESVRSNMANEDIKRDANDISMINAKANRSNAKSNAKNAETNARNADINARNADVNAYNALVNKQNADTNARNANTNAFNANVNARNADINAQNAVTNRMNANTKQYEAQTGRMNYGENVRHNTKSEALTEFKNSAEAVNRYGQLANDKRMTNSNIALNEAKIEESQSKTKANKAKAGESTSKSVLNYVSAVDKGWGTFKSVWDTLLKDKPDYGQMFFGFGGN